MRADHFATELSDEATRLLGRLHTALSTIATAPSAQQPALLAELFRAAHTLKAVFSTGGLQTKAAQVHEFEELLQAVRLGQRQLDASLIETLTSIASQLTLSAAELPATMPVLPAASLPRRHQTSGQFTDRTANSSLVAQLPISADLRSVLTEFEDYRLAESLRLQRHIYEVRVQLAALRFDQELATLREQLSVGGEVISILPEISASGQQVDFNILFATTEPAAAIKTALGSRQVVITEVVYEPQRATAGEPRAVTKPLAELFALCAVAVRQLAQSSGKPVEVRQYGGDLRISTQLLRRLREPLLHLVRNAVAHGIELPAVRQQRHKPVNGRIVLRGTLKRHQLLLEVSDDGQGIDPHAVYTRAVALGVIPAGARLSRSEMINLIFLPGLSTIEQATATAGRGIGLDVVAESIAIVQGRLQVTSRPGKGTRFSLKFPLRAVPENAS